MAKKRVLTMSMAFLASVGMLAAGCSDKNEYGAKQAPVKPVEQFGPTTGMNGSSTYSPGIGNYPDTQGSAYLSGTGYYDSTRTGVAGSALDDYPGITTDTIKIKANPPKSSEE